MTWEMMAALSGADFAGDVADPGNPTFSGSLSEGAEEETFDLTGLVSGRYSLAGNFGALSCKITIADAAGKKVATGSVSNGRLKFKDALVIGGDYTLTVTGTAKSEGDFLLEVIPEELYTQGNNADDDYRNLTSEYMIGYGGRIEDEWVGFGDTIDYRRFQIETSGSYELKILGLTAPVKLTVYEMKTNGSLKTMRSVTIKPKYDAKTGTWKNSSVLLDDLMLSTSSRYYFSVQSTSAKQGGATNYDIYVDGTLYTQGNNADDNYLTLTPEYTIGYGTEIENEWVGFGDVVDYRKLAITETGAYGVTVAGLTASAKLTVYEMNAKGKLTRVKSVTVNPKYDRKTGVWTKNVGDLEGLLLSTNATYFVKVEAVNAQKGGNTGYDLDVGGTIFNNPNNALLNNSWDEVKNTNGQLPADIAGEWVGYGDPADWFKLVVDDATAGNYGFELVADTAKAAKMTLYLVQDNGKLKRMAGGTLFDNIDLAAGSYALAIESADKGRGKKNTGYAVDVTLNRLLPPADAEGQLA